MNILTDLEFQAVVEAIQSAIEELGLLEVEYDNDGWCSDGKQALIEALEIMGVETDDNEDE